MTLNLIFSTTAMVPVCIFYFYAGNCHQIVASVWVKAVKVTPRLLVVRVEVAKVAQLIGLSCKCGTNYILYCGLARAWVETVKMARRLYSPRTTKNTV